MDTLLFAGLTFGLMMVGVLFFNQSMPIDVILPTVFLIMLTLHLLIHKTKEKCDIEEQKQWINQQDISANLKKKYREDIDLTKSNIIWLVIRFCLFVSLAVVISVLISSIFNDKKINKWQPQANL